MKKRITDFFFSHLPAKTAYAHCDIPCGIYDPHTAQLAAHTVIRMTQLIKDLKPQDETDDAKKLFIHNLTRYTAVKEEHAELVKKEVRVIWGDYFKPEHLKEYPEINTLVFQIMKLASKTRQTVDMDSAKNLLTSVQKFAEIFWKTKNRQTIRIKSPYPTEGDMVLPQ